MYFIKKFKYLNIKIVKYRSKLRQFLDNLPKKPKLIIFCFVNRDTGSYVEVMKGQNPPEIFVLKAPVLNSSWMDNSVLSGETKDFDTLCCFPSLLALEGFNISEVKYFGGLAVALKFVSLKAADVFRANINIWLRWFSKIDFASKLPHFPGRIAWLKISGLPFAA